MHQLGWLAVALGILAWAPSAEAQTDQRMRIYVAAGNLADGTSAYGTGELGVQWIRREERVGKGWAMSVSSFTGTSFTVPSVNVEGFGQYLLLTDVGSTVALVGGAGVSVFLIVPLPAIHFAIIAELPVLDGLSVDVGVHSRAFFDIYTGSDGAVSSTLQLGVSF